MQELGELAAKLRRSTVQVLNGRGSGSGVLWNAAGLVITNAHVAAGTGSTQVELWDGTRAAARPVATNRECDLAALEILPHGTAEPVVVGDSASIRPGDLVVAVGNPLGFLGAASIGVVHQVAPLAGQDGARSWIHSSVRLAPGNSGGPLANANGEVIGINTMVVADGRFSVALAIPASMVLSFLQGGATATLGVTVRPVRAADGLFGILILEICPGSAAERASFLPGDLLTGAAGSSFTVTGDLMRALALADAGRLTLQFRRGGVPVERTVTVQLEASRPMAA